MEEMHFSVPVSPVGKFPCPCCGYKTLPVPEQEALCYICPVCLWEVDLFIASPDEPSDLNHGLTLRQARGNVRRFGAVRKELKKFCRCPWPAEYEETEK